MGRLFLACNIRKKLDANDYSFGHLALMSLHYLVKCRLLSLLFASDVNVCRLHLFWKSHFEHML